MKLINFKAAGKESYGLYNESGVIDLKEKFKDEFPTLKDFIANGQLENAKQYSNSEVDYQLSEISFRPVIENPEKIFCVGTNYDDHRVETNREKSAYPVIFHRFAKSQIGHEEKMIIPKESDKLDFEGELAVVIGKSGRRIEKENVYEYIAGYSCYNDGSVRDWQKHTHQWGPGKNFEATGAFGPYLVTRDEIGDEEVLSLKTYLNEEVVQETTTDLLIFSIPEIISYISTYITLEPGDVIVTGTPGGVGARRTPPLFMKAGDTVLVEISKVGTLQNTIAEEATVEGQEESQRSTLIER